MKKNTIILTNRECVNKREQEIIEKFLLRYETYIEHYKKYGIRLTIQPCYYYNGKYRTDKKISGCFLAFRIRLYPEQYTFSQAVNKNIFKEFISRKIMTIKGLSTGYKVRQYSNNDIALEKFLKKYLKHAREQCQRGREPTGSIRESVEDIVRSLFFVYRYRKEVKRTFRGYSIEWLYLLIVVVLIAFRVYMHIRRLTY